MFCYNIIPLKCKQNKNNHTKDYIKERLRQQLFFLIHENTFILCFGKQSVSLLVMPCNVKCAEINRCIYKQEKMVNMRENQQMSIFTNKRRW